MSSPATAAERRKILEMVAAGQLNAGEAASLLSAAAGASAATEAAEAEESVPESATEDDALMSARKEAVASEEAAPPEKPSPAKAPAAQAPQPPDVSASGRWLNIRVEDVKSGRRRVAVKVPLRLVHFGLRIGSAFTPELQRVDWDALSSELAAGGGMIVDVQDDEDGERVQIFVE
ncbi:MAG: hypothetical protein R3272_12320 [Candidatus Promineifilaceae bacterium]|nr:hypothetical protein [Candidatus Promineifilaceae bacterium]